MKKLLLSILLILSISCLSACAGQNELMGYWLSSDGEFYHFDVSTVTIGVYSGEAIENSVYDYKLDDDIIKLESNGKTYQYYYSINQEENALCLSPVSDPSEKITYYGTDSIMQEEIIVGLSIQNS